MSWISEDPPHALQACPFGHSGTSPLIFLRIFLSSPQLMHVWAVSLTAKLLPDCSQLLRRRPIHHSPARLRSSTSLQLHIDSIAAGWARTPTRPRPGRTGRRDAQEGEYR